MISEITIKNDKGDELTLTLEELKKLKDELDILLGKENNYDPYAPFRPLRDDMFRVPSEPPYKPLEVTYTNEDPTIPWFTVSDREGISTDDRVVIPHCSCGSTAGN